MAQVGGVIGVWPSGFSFVDARDWVGGIARMVDAAGVDHVGIGTDMEGAMVICGLTMGPLAMVMGPPESSLPPLASGRRAQARRAAVTARNTRT
jgi:microsomal dipeptidase-like Zn-dependent dipeptidase